jgi:hypothetical protein
MQLSAWGSLRLLYQPRLLWRTRPGDAKVEWHMEGLAPATMSKTEADECMMPIIFRWNSAFNASI